MSLLVIAIDLSEFTPNVLKLAINEIELENQIALEPISGPSNSFNNKLGLQILEAKKTFHIQWNIKLESN